MAEVNSNQLIKFKDAVLEIGKPQTIGERPIITQTGNSLSVSNLDETWADSGVLRELNAITTTSRSVDKSEQTFNYVGSSGWTDAIHLTRRISQSFTTYFFRSSDPNQDYIDPVTRLILSGGEEDDVEVFFRQMFYLGGSGSSDFWRTVACNGLISNLQESTPGDNVIELTFDLSSVGTVYRLVQSSSAGNRPSITSS